MCLDASVFAAMLKDSDCLNLKKLQYKYSPAAVTEFLRLAEEQLYVPLSIRDFNGRPLVYSDFWPRGSEEAMRVLLTPRFDGEVFGSDAMEEEIYSSLKIENIESSRDVIHRILKGCAPTNEEEARVFGMKKGLEFIGNSENTITEENLYTLYRLTVGEYLPPENRLLPGRYYRHDSVFVIGQNVEHEGLAHARLPEYMAELMAFIREPSPMDDMVKAALIHFYIAYLHPYFDGNGRTARLVQLWYLVQCGYPSALFVPISAYIRETKNRYYKAFRQVEDNALISGRIDAAPFLCYFTENVYDRLRDDRAADSAAERYRCALREGRITRKEAALWEFVLSHYGRGEFSTKQLERDCGAAAYATIRAFVLKFTELGLLLRTDYGSRPRYRVLT